MFTTFRLGVFIVAMLLIFASGIFLIGRNEFMFHSTYCVKADFNHVAGLIEGASVRIGGIHKGTVARIVLPSRPGEQVTVWMDLESSTRDIIKKDSVASIHSEGLLGDKYIEISFGSNDAERLGEYETISSQPPIDFSDIIKKTDEILNSARATVQNAVEATDQMKSVTAKVNQGTGTLGSLVNDKTIYNQASAGTTAFRENMEALRNNFLLRGFFNRRGYKDSSELTRHAIPQFPSAQPTKTFSYEAKQLFEKTDTAKLKNQKELNEAGKFLEKNGFGLAVVTAVAGTTGDSNQKQVLTQARTIVVRDYLVDNFSLDDTRIKTIGLGKSKERNDADKVQIVIYPASANAMVSQRK